MSGPDISARQDKTIRAKRAVGAAALALLAGPPIGGVALGVVFGLWQFTKLPQKLVAGSFSPMILADTLQVILGTTSLFAVFSYVAGWLSALVVAVIFAVAVYLGWVVTLSRSLAVGLVGGLAAAVNFGSELGVESLLDDSPGLAAALIYCSLAASAGVFFIARRAFPALIGQGNRLPHSERSGTDD